MDILIKLNFIYMAWQVVNSQNIHVSEKEIKHAWGKCNLLNLLFTVHKECRGSVSSMELLLLCKTHQHKLCGRDVYTDHGKCDRHTNG